MWTTIVLYGALIASMCLGILKAGWLDDRDDTHAPQRIFRGWTFIYAEAPERYASLQGLAYLLGGVEISGGIGRAGASSRVRNEVGDSFLIASGNELERSFAISLYGGPSTTGWRIGPTGGWFTRQLSITGFAFDLPGSRPMDGATDVSGLCADAESGEPLACRAPNVYELELQSYYAGLMGGYEAIVGNDRLRLMGGLYANVNAIELRSTKVVLADDETSETSWRPFRSFGFQATGGLHFPGLHTALRTTLDYQRYARFDFGRPLEFRGPVLYDEERAMFVRPRYTVENMALGVVSLKLSVAYMF